VALWVEDEGQGLPADALDAVFRPFVRSAGQEPEQSGMGLGLWVVKSIVQRHGGRVVLEGGARRTRVSVLLPTTAASEPGVGPAPAPTAGRPA
jgi:signal transduction histidine kinase